MKKKQRNTNKKPFRLRFTTRLLLAVIVLSLGINGYYVYDIFGRPIREARAEAQKGMTKEQLEVQKRRDAQEKAENEKHIEGKIHYESADGRIGYEDGLILNSGDAMEALAVLQGQLGIHNAREEYRCERENVSKNRTFYKMQQVCNGIPVYGYNLLIAVNEKGNLLSIDGAYADVQEVNTDTKISSSDAEKLVRNYIKSETDAQKDPDPEEEEDSYRPEVQGTVVFLENGKPVIGYQVQVFMQGINDPVEELVINANTGDILKDTAKMRFEMVTGDLQGQEVNQTLQYWKENADTYQLRDVDKNMRVCKATKNTIKKLDKHSELIEWESPNTNPNAIGVDALANFQRISNYYRAAYGRNGIENNLNAELQIIVDVKKIKLGKETFNLQNNAGMCGTQLVCAGEMTQEGTASYTAKLDVMGHEYNHGVVNAESNLLEGNPAISDSQLTEQAAIGEGLADLFGELTEDYCKNQQYDGSCNWSNAVRNLKSPSGTDILDASDFLAGTTDCHYGAALISHPAYLMANGINGESSKAIDTRSLGILFYELIPYTTNFTDFVDFRRLLEETASTWRQRDPSYEDRLTSAQLGCVLTAFDRVGIEHTYDYALKPNATLKVYDQNNELYDNYHIKIEPLADSGVEVVPAVDTDVKTDTYKLKLEPGIYNVTLTDLDNTDLKHNTTFIVNENDAQSRNAPYLDEGEIFSEFGAEPRDVALALDVSGSMSGTPISETRQAAIKFVNTVLDASPATRISIVTYSNNASQTIASSNDKAELTAAIQGIGSSGGTNIHDGLASAYDMIQSRKADTKMVVLMSDGAPTDGPKEDGNFRQPIISQATTIKGDDTLIYALGFFHNLSGDEKAECQSLMAEIASSGYHYEVSDADSVQFVFDDIAQQVSGGEYIYIRVACPVDVTVKKNGEVLSSSEKNLSTRTEFGTLSFEGEEDEVKILRLKKSDEYEICINGTGKGTMDYSISFSDDKGHYSDERTFRNVPVTRDMVAFTSTKESGKTELQVDEDGDGVFELQYKAKAGSKAEETSKNRMIYVMAGVAGCAILWLAAKILIAVRRNKRNHTCPGCKRTVDKKAQFCPVCGSQIQRTRLFFPEKVVQEKERAGVRNAKLIAMLLVMLLTAGTSLLHRAPATTVYRQIVRCRYVSAQMIYEENVEDTRLARAYLKALAGYHLGRIERAYSYRKISDAYASDVFRALSGLDIGKVSEQAEDDLVYMSKVNSD